MVNKQIIIFGEVLFDCFPDGHNVIGGAPFNVAWHLQAFGTAPLFISSVGEDPQGDQIKTAMTRWGMNLDGLQTHPDRPTGQVEVTILDNEPFYDIVNQCAYDYIQTDQLPNFHGQPLLYHGSLAIRNSVSAETLLAVKHQTAPDVFLDVNLRPPWWNIRDIILCLNDTSWLKLNHHELAELVSDRPEEDIRIAKLFSSTPIKSITLTRGEKGATTYSLDGPPPMSISPQKTPSVIDTVGAGDAFSSVLLLGKIKNWDMETTLKRAQEFASAIVGIRGATTADPTFYIPFVNAWE
ncbi:MAG: carbohydrate kinase [Deltaproteobacteria bacterium]|nr:carbohydrate kinase [Deltaproteobacteria bacterium]